MSQYNIERTDKIKRIVPNSDGQFKFVGFASFINAGNNYTLIIFEDWTECVRVRRAEIFYKDSEFCTFKDEHKYCFDIIWDEPANR